MQCLGSGGRELAEAALEAFPAHVVVLLKCVISADRCDNHP